MIKHLAGAGRLVRCSLLEGMLLLLLCLSAVSARSASVPMTSICHLLDRSGALSRPAAASTRRASLFSGKHI